MKRCVAFLLILLFIVLCFGCTDTGGDGTEPADTQEQTPGSLEAAPESAGETLTGQEAQKPDGPVNPLTGISDGLTYQKAHRMPVSIMINNLEASLPQCGISKADIIYEMLAEGNITRLLAIFQDPSGVSRIGSIRSARPYFMEIAQGYNAVYLHFGGSVPAYAKIAKHEIINLDGIQATWDGSLYYRDPERKKTYALEHTVFTSGERIEKALSSLNRDLNISDPQPAFSFSETSSAASGSAANKIDIHYSNYSNPWFEYDQDTKNYLRFEYGEAHMDAEYGEQISVKNVFVLKMKTEAVPNNSLHLIEITTAGTGSGYYACEGNYIPITWKKKDASSPILFYGADGSELQVAPGNTFVCCIPTGIDPTIS